MKNRKRPRLNYITIVRGRNNIFELLPIENINCHKVTLSMPMLASF